MAVSCKFCPRNFHRWKGNKYQPGRLNIWRVIAWNTTEKNNAFLAPHRTLRITVHFTKFIFVRQYIFFVRQRNSVSFSANGNSTEKRTG